jgi:hypothetical protein
MFTLVAKLTASGRPLSGQAVSFSAGQTSLCSARTDLLGVVICLVTEPQARLTGPDNDPVRASYPGGANYLPASATAVPPRFPWIYHGTDPAHRKAPTP